jgi:hypothetical protein
MTQLDDIDFIAVRIQRERRDPNSQLQCLAGLCNSPNQRLKSRWFDKKSRADLPAGFSMAVIQCSSGICFYWNKMTKEVPGIRPAVISTGTGTRLDEYRRFRRVVRNVYTHSFDPAKLGKLVNPAPELFALTKAELLAVAAVLEH